MRSLHRFALLQLAACTMALLAPGLARADLQKAQDDRAVLVVTSSVKSVLLDVLANDGALGPGLRILKAFKPAHGSVALESGRIRYTPTPGFQGSDSFRYMAQADKSQPGQATVNVEVGEGGVVLRLVGRVVDSPVAGATVTASIGGFDFTAVADGNGNYVLDIAALNGDAFVTLTATGTSASGATVRFYSVVGEMARLAVAAGSDGILVRDELNQVNITNLSTAQYILLANANGGTPVVNDQQLLPLVQNISLDQLVELAAIIKLVVDQGVALPAGTSDALALISSPSALQAFKDTLADGQLAAAVVAVTQDPNVTPGFRAGALPSGYALIAPSAPGTIHQGDNAGALLTLVGSASASSGQALFYHSDPDSGAAQTWALVGGDIVLTQDNPVATPFFSNLVLNPSCGLLALVRLQETPLSMRVHRVQDGAGVDYLELIGTFYRHYDVDQNPNDTCVPPPDGIQTDPPYRILGFEDGSGEMPFTAGESLGRLVLTHDQLLAGYFGNAAVFDFATHTVNIAGTLPNFSSTINNGRLRLQLTSSVDGQVTDYEFRRYQLDGRKGAGLMSFVTSPNGKKVARFMLAARIDDSLVFDYGSLPAIWRSSGIISRLDNTAWGQYVVLKNDAGLTGLLRFINLDGSASESFPFTWGIESDQMVARSYRQSGANVPSCAAPGSTYACWITRVRTWLPIARDGNRIYVLEEITSPFGVPGAPLQVLASRVGYFEPN